MNKFIVNRKKIIIIRHPRLTSSAGFRVSQVSGIRSRFRRLWKSLGLGNSR